MIELFVVLFREGLESLLIVAIALSYLKQTGRDGLLPTAYAAVGASLAFSVAAGVGLSAVGAMSAFWEGVMALCAALLVLTCVIQMHRLGPRMAQEIRHGISQLHPSSNISTHLALFAFIFLMISREGIEAATVVASMVSESNSTAVLWNAIAGLLAAALVAGLWTRYGRKINLTLFFKATSIFLLLFFVQLLIYSVHEFSEAGALPVLDNAWVHIITEPIGPEGKFGAWLTYGIMLAPMLYVAYQMLTRRQT